MKKNLNIIQIKGVKGILMAVFIVSCLIAGFIFFPGWLGMLTWNFITTFFIAMPKIGLLQGLLLWAILVTAYFTFRKERVVVCMRTPQGLSEEELKSVFSDLKRQSELDPVLQAMMKAREAEFKVKTFEETEKVEETKTEVIEASTTEIPKL